MAVCIIERGNGTDNYFISYQIQKLFDKSGFFDSQGLYIL